MRLNLRRIVILALLSAAGAAVSTLVVHVLDGTNVVFAFGFSFLLLFAAAYIATSNSNEHSEASLLRDKREPTPVKFGRTIFRGLCYAGGMLLVAIAFDFLVTWSKGGSKSILLNADLGHDLIVIVLTMLVFGLGISALEQWYSNRWGWREKKRR